MIFAFVFGVIGGLLAAAFAIVLVNYFSAEE